MGRRLSRTEDGCMMGRAPRHREPMQRQEFNGQQAQKKSIVQRNMMG